MIKNYGSKEIGSQKRNFTGSLHNDRELDGYKTYLAHKPSNDRYQILPSFPADSILAAPKTLEWPDSLYADSEKFDKEFGTRDFKLRPNLYFLKALHALTEQRLIAVLKDWGLKDLFKAEVRSLTEVEFSQLREHPETVAEAIDKLLAHYKFRGKKPTMLDIKNKVIQFAQSTANARKARHMDHFTNFPPKSLIEQELYTFGGPLAPQLRNKEYYRKIEYLSVPLAFIFEDHGLRLEDFMLSLHRDSYEFHDGSARLETVAQFLGLAN